MAFLIFLRYCLGSGKPRSPSLTADGNFFAQKCVPKQLYTESVSINQLVKAITRCTPNEQKQTIRQFNRMARTCHSELQSPNPAIELDFKQFRQLKNCPFYKRASTSTAHGVARRDTPNSPLVL
jgi:hypothetical protein